MQNAKFQKTSPGLDSNCRQHGKQKTEAMRCDAMESKGPKRESKGSGALRTHRFVVA